MIVSECRGGSLLPASSLQSAVSVSDVSTSAREGCETAWSVQTISNTGSPGDVDTAQLFGKMAR